MVASIKTARLAVGVRELRQNLSVYLEQVATGTAFRVTDRGREVAMLVPIPPAASTTERLIAAGRAAPATRDLLSLGRPRLRVKGSLAKALQDVRDDIV
jgi:prevent-host-death family protein